MAENNSDENRLGAVERLLVLSLIRQGLKQAHVAAALDMHRTSLSRQFPKGLLAEVASLKGKGIDTEDGQEAS